MTDRRRDPAPPPLRLLQEFLNTNDIEDARERFISPGALQDWLLDRDLLRSPTRLSTDDLTTTIELREALRALVSAHNALPADVEGATATVNHAGEGAELLAIITSDGRSELKSRATGLPGALGQIVAIVHRAIADDTWTRMKACERDTCRWAFYDHSKNRSGRWCQSVVCGSRERSRRSYQRRRAAQHTQPRQLSPPPRDCVSHSGTGDDAHTQEQE